MHVSIDIRNSINRHVFDGNINSRGLGGVGEPQCNLKSGTAKMNILGCNFAIN